MYKPDIYKMNKTELRIYILKLKAYNTVLRAEHCFHDGMYKFFLWLFGGPAQRK